MQTTATTLDVPKVDSDEPVEVVPVASVAPLDGPADGERINLFALAPVGDDETAGSDVVLDAMADLRERVLKQPLRSTCAAFALGFLVGRVLR